MIPKKLTCQEVIMILMLYWNFDASISSLALYFNVSDKVVRRIVAGKGYKDCYRPSMFGFTSYKDMNEARLDKSFYLRKIYGKGRPSKPVEEILEEIDPNIFRTYMGQSKYIEV